MGGKLGKAGRDTDEGEKRSRMGRRYQLADRFTGGINRSEPDFYRIEQPGQYTKDTGGKEEGQGNRGKRKSSK